MRKELFTVREIQKRDIVHITQYWMSANSSFLRGMGVDIKKMASKEE